MATEVRRRFRYEPTPRRLLYRRRSVAECADVLILVSTRLVVKAFLALLVLAVLIGPVILTCIGNAEVARSRRAQAEMRSHIDDQRVRRARLIEELQARENDEELRKRAATLGFVRKSEAVPVANTRP